MNLSVKDAAKLLSVAEKTIYRWIKQDIVPAYKIHENYRFNRAELLEWATFRRMGVSAEVFNEPESVAQPLPALSEALENGGIFYRIGGASREKVLLDVVDNLRLPDEVDRDYLFKVLLAREKDRQHGCWQWYRFSAPAQSGSAACNQADPNSLFSGESGRLLRS